MSDYLQVLNAALAGVGSVDVENEHRTACTARWTSPYRLPDVCFVVGVLARSMSRIAGEQTSGTILWMADERAICDFIAPRITAAATDAGRPTPRIVAGVPVAVCSNRDADDARVYASEVLGHAHFSPNYVRLLEHGDAADVGDTMAVGDEQTVLARLLRYRDAGVTDLAVRIVPLGAEASGRTASRARTHHFIASLCPEL